MCELITRQIAGGVSFRVKVVPGSSRTTVAGTLGGMLKVKVAAAAEKGKANTAVIELLAAELGLRKNSIRITSGRTNPVKEVQAEGATAEQIAKLAGGQGFGQ